MSSLAPPDVFVSYSSADLARVKPIADALTARGIGVWRDQDRIRGGDEWNGDIEWAIANSRVLVVMCSPDMIRSENVLKEVNYAWNAAHRRYVPVWLTPAQNFPVGSGFGLFLGSLHRIETAGRPPADWLPELLAALARHGVAGTAPAGPRRPRHPDRDTAPAEDDAPPAPDTTGDTRRVSPAVWAASALGVLIVLIAAGWFLFGRPHPAGRNDPPAPLPPDPAPAPVAQTPVPPPAARPPTDPLPAATAWVRWDAGTDCRTGVLVQAAGGYWVVTPWRDAGTHPPTVVFPDYSAGKLATNCESYYRTQAELAAAGRSWVPERRHRLTGGPASVLMVLRVPRPLPDGVKAVTLATADPGANEPVMLCGMSGVKAGRVWQTAGGTVTKIAPDRLFDFVPDREVRGRALEHNVPAGPQDAGAPLVNGRGELVGVHVGPGQTANLAVTAADLRAALRQLAP